jgi:hypothetical protein
MERGGLTENPRASVIVHPPNGRIPPVQDGVQIQRGDQNGITEIPGERPVRYTHGGIARNGPEDRGLSERCMAFNSGDSRGYFDGQSLVVETRNFTHKVGSLSLRDRACGDASQRLLIERFTPTGEATMNYEWIIEDPVTFTDRIVGIMPMTRTKSTLYEYACHAGNYAIGTILNGARAESGEL